MTHPRFVAARAGYIRRARRAGAASAIVLLGLASSGCTGEASDLGDLARPNEIAVAAPPAPSDVVGPVSSNGEHATGRRAPARNLLLVTVDTLRADRLGMYGHPRLTSPNLDAWASTSSVFEAAQSSSSWTLPALASLMTSTWPSTHGCTGTRDALSTSLHTLAELLADSCVRTAAVTSNPFLRTHRGFAQGFEHYEVVADPRRSRLHARRGAHDRGVTSDLITERAMALLAERRVDPARWFLWVHYFDPHASYMPHRTLGTDFGTARPIDRYDSEIAFTDVHAGHLLGRLAELGLADDTAVVFTADHGEEFRDHGGHGHRTTLYGEVVRVPLVVHVPGLARGRIGDVVSLVDVLPTCLDALGLSVPDGLAGRSLLPLMKAGGGPPRVALAELAFRDRPDMLAVMDGRWKLLLTEGAGVTALFDVHADPGELRDIQHDAPEVVQRLRAAGSRRLQEARALATAHARNAPLSLDPEELRQLAALGYADA